MKKSNLLFFLIIVLLVGGLLFFCNRPKTTSIKEQLKVGVILPLTGEVASYGNDCKNGILFTNIADSLSVEYVFEDSKGDPKTAIAAYNKLITIDKVDYVIGDMFSNTTLSLAPLAKKQKKLLVSPTASSKDISANNIYALSVFPCETYESKLVADFAKVHYSKFGVLYEKVAAAQAMRDAYINEIGKEKVVFDEAFESSIGNFKEIIYKIKNSGCESVYLITYTNNALKLLSQMKEIGFSVDLMGQSALYDPAIIESLVDYKANFYLTGPLFNKANDDKMSQEFLKRFSDVYKKEPNQMSTQGYIAAIVAYNLNKNIQAGNYSKEQIINYKNEFFGSQFSFGDDLTSLSGLRIYKFEDNDFIPVVE